jgi:hypothetical protein
MLYNLGMIIVMLSLAFVGGEPTVPIIIAATGALIMAIGRRFNNEEADSER